MKFFRTVVGLVLLLAVAAGAALWEAERRLDEPFKGHSEPAATLRIDSGMSARGILAELEREGVLSSALLARLYLVYKLGDPALQAGEYRFEGALSAKQVLRSLIDGRVLAHPVTLIEGLTLADTAEHLAAAGFGQREVFLAAMASPALVADLDPEAEDLEGYLFPDTYGFAAETPEGEIVAALVANFRRRYEARVAPLLGPGDPRSPREIVTLASIVEKEARLDEERPTIAGVYAHRLRRGIALYADPTVIYALQRLGRWDGNLRRDDLKVDSPYNTYVNPGLPPGPICSPGLGSLEAAAAPDDVPYLYFVSRNDGSHVFARTLSEHNRNVQRWQKDYWRQRRADEAAAAGGADSEIRN